MAKIFKSDFLKFSAKNIKTILRNAQCKSLSMCIDGCTYAYYNLYAYLNGVVYRENLEIGELEVLLSLPNFLHFKSDSVN